MNVKIIFLVLFLSLFSFSFSQDLSLEFKPMYGSQAIKKDTWYLNSKGDSIQFDKIRFYVTDVILNSNKNNEIKVDSSYFLIDAFKKESLTRNLKLDKKTKIKSIQFSLGVREELNKAGALSNDLDPVNGMFWVWQTGYINVKIEGKSPSCPTRKNKFVFHVGGYKKPNATVRKINLDFNKSLKDKIEVVVDLKMLFDQLELKKQHSLMIPGEKASQLATKTANIFIVND